MNNQQTTSPFKKIGLDVMQNYPLRRIHFSQHQASYILFHQFHIGRAVLNLLNLIMYYFSIHCD